MDQIAFYAFVFAVAVLLSFLFSGMESGVFAMSPMRVRQKMKSGNRRAAILHRYVEDLEDFLWTILVGNTLASFAAFGLAALLLYKLLDGRLEWAAPLFVALTFLFYALADLLPKMLFQMFPTRLCIALASPFRYLHWALMPVVRLASAFSNLLLWITGGRAFQGHLFRNRSELRSIVQASSDVLSSEERAMITRVLDLQNLTVRSVTRPLARVVSASATLPVPEALRLMREERLSHLPVWEELGGKKRIAGIASLDGLLFSSALRSERPVGEFVRPVVSLKEDMLLDEALRHLQRHGRRVGVVLDLSQQEVGIVALRDILKAIFGEVTL